MLNCRRKIIKASAGLVVGGPLIGLSWGDAKAATLAATPACGHGPTAAQIEGPFFSPQTPKRSDLTDGLPGQILIFEGRVLNTACQPLPNAVVELWGCDSAGNYDNTGYTLRGHQMTDAQGRFRFKTIKPGAYGNSSFRRTPHLHVKVQGPRAASLLTTQLYFPQEPLNRQDGFFNEALQLNVRRHKPLQLLATFDFVVPA